MFSYQFTKHSDGWWIRNFHFAEGTIITNKITRGSFEKEASDNNGNVSQNSDYEIIGKDIMVINIKKWKE